MRVPFSLGTAGGAPAFDPATLALSWWNRAAYGGDPWAGTSSAGTSSGVSLIDGAAPSVGAALNGLAPADYNGTSNFQTTASAMGDIVTSAAGFLGFLFKARSAAAPAGNPYQDPCFVALVSRGDFSFGFNSSGVCGSFLDLTANRVTATQAASTGAWHFGHMRWNATTMEVGVDGTWAAPESVAGGGADDANFAATSWRVGCDWLAGTFFDVLIAEAIGSKLRLSDTDTGNIKSYFNSRYALSL